VIWNRVTTETLEPTGPDELPEGTAVGFRYDTVSAGQQTIHFGCFG
jgi:hypothetical protein